MTSTIKVCLAHHPYDVKVGHGILVDVPRYLRGLNVGKDAVVITHPLVERLYGVTLTAALKKAGYSVKILNVPEGEKSKSASYALRLIESIAAYDIGKELFIIALGGGVIGDLAGFVAAIYKRGIPYIQVPTTLLAQIDSSIGGKTAIDLKMGKNLVGAFYQPKLVVSDTKVLKTLNRRQMSNGLAEAVKYGVILDANLFNFIDAHHQRFFNNDVAVLNRVVRRCAQIKAGVVAADEKETKGLRTVLNFGHTVGHAIEAASRYHEYHHGEAVGLGMRVAARISVDMGLLPPRQEQRINQLITAVGLPSKIIKVKLIRIFTLMSHDKKFVGGHNRFVLAHRVGRVSVVKDVPQARIMAAIQAYSE